MEAIADLIRSWSPFLAKEFNETVPEDKIREALDKCLGGPGGPGAAKAKRSTKPKATANKEISTEDVKDSSSDAPLSKADYDKMKTTELRALCKMKGLTTTGTKENVVHRLLNGGAQKTEDAKVEKKVAAAKEKLPKKAKAAAKPIVPKVIEMIVPADIELSTDKHGNLYHEATGMVFEVVSDDETVVIGHLSEDGQIMPLTGEDVEVCKKYNFTYTLKSDFDFNGEREEELTDVE